MTASRLAVGVLGIALTLTSTVTSTVAPAHARGEDDGLLIEQMVQGRAARAALDALAPARQRSVAARNDRSVAQVRAVLADPSAGLARDGKLFFTETVDPDAAPAPALPAASMTPVPAPAPQATPTLAQAREMDQLDQTSVWGTVSLTSVLWGTRLDLTCSYDEPASGYQEGEHTYALVVHTRDGGTEQVATWKGLPGRTMRVTGATALTTDQIASVEVRDAAGHPLLELTS